VGYWKLSHKTRSDEHGFSGFGKTNHHGNVRLSCSENRNFLLAIENTPLAQRAPACEGQNSMPEVGRGP